MESGDPGIVAEEDCLGGAGEDAVAFDGEVVRLDAELALLPTNFGEGSFEGGERGEVGECGRREGIGEAGEAPEADVVVLRAGGEEDFARGDVVGEGGGRGSGERGITWGGG